MIIVDKNSSTVTTDYGNFATKKLAWIYLSISYRFIHRQSSRIVVMAKGWLIPNPGFGVRVRAQTLFCCVDHRRKLPRKWSKNAYRTDWPEL